MCAGSVLDEVAKSLRSRVAVVGRPVERSTLEEQMAKLNVPAVSVAVLAEDGTIGSRAWGATPQTLFQAASISKPVCAIATVALAAAGVFVLDQEVNELLRTWKLPNGEGVTVRRILSHSAGLSVHGFPGYARNAPRPSVVQISWTGDALEVPSGGITLTAKRKGAR